MEPIRSTPLRLSRLVVRHGGNRAAIARATGWSLNTVRRLLRLHGLERLADEHALRSRRPGPRRQSAAGAAEERQRIAEATLRGTDAQAAASLGMPIATFYRRLAAYGLSARGATPPSP